MNRKQLEDCAWSKTPKDERRSQIERYDWKTKKTITKRLKGNAREVLVFNPSGTTEGTINDWWPLWSLYSDELEQRCKEEHVPKLRAPYNRMRADYTGDVESSPGSRATTEGISGARSGHATRQHRAKKKSRAQLDREIAEALAKKQSWHVMFQMPGSPWVWVSAKGSGGTMNPDDAYDFGSREAAKARSDAMMGPRSSLAAKVVSRTKP